MNFKPGCLWRASNSLFINFHSLPPKQMIYCTAGSVLPSSPCLWFSCVFSAFSFFLRVNLVWPMENCQKSVFWFIKRLERYLFCCLYPTGEQGPDTQMKQSDRSVFGAPSSSQSRKQAHEICTRRGHRWGGRGCLWTPRERRHKKRGRNWSEREEKHACWRLCLCGNDIHLPSYFMHQILRTICSILANITVHLWEPFISLIHWSTGGQEKDGGTAETKESDRQAIKVWTSSNFQNKYYLCLSYPKSVCLCANVVIRINRGSALHEHQTIIFRKSHLGCFDLTDESIYMTERVCSQNTLHTAGINQDYFVFAQIWEQRCLGKKKTKRGRREDSISSSKERSAPLVSEQRTPDLLANAWTVKQTSHI